MTVTPEKRPELPEPAERPEDRAVRLANERRDEQRAMGLVAWNDRRLGEIDKLIERQPMSLERAAKEMARLGGFAALERQVWGRFEYILHGPADFGPNRTFRQDWFSAGLILEKDKLDLQRNLRGCSQVVGAGLLLTDLARWEQIAKLDRNDCCLLDGRESTRARGRSRGGGQPPQRH